MAVPELFAEPPSRVANTMALPAEFSLTANASYEPTQEFRE